MNFPLHSNWHPSCPQDLPWIIYSIVTAQYQMMHAFPAWLTSYPFFKLPGTRLTDDLPSSTHATSLASASPPHESPQPLPPLNWRSFAVVYLSVPDTSAPWCHWPQLFVLVVVQSLSPVWLCDRTDCTTPGFPVFQCLPEFAQIHVHWVSDAV